MNFSIQKIKVVAALFIAIGSFAWADFISMILRDSVVAPGLEMALLPAGIGLLRDSQKWRKSSIILVSLFMLIVITTPLIGYTVSPLFHVRALGITLDPSSPVAVALVLGYTTLHLGVLVWLFRALRHPDVVEHFDGA